MPITSSQLHDAVKSIIANDPTGLTAVWSPMRPTIDIIFVHGLGGTSGRTWCCDKDHGTFWPSWLHEEPELRNARVHAFGYSANIAGPSNSSGIFDFARDLLFKMKYEYVNYERGPPIGSVPIIFVAHSMGGLVIKMAFTTARNDDDYRDMIAQVKAMVFLSTPHRGCTDAKYLDTLLRTFNLSHDYIKELSASGPMLQQINHEFSNTCRDLKLFSIYETAKTFKAGVGAYVSTVVAAVQLSTDIVKIVSKNSGVTDLFNEARCSMAVDHHMICKFRHREEQGYKYVRNILIDLTMPLLRHEVADTDPSDDEDSQMQQLSGALSVNENDLADDFDWFRNAAKPGTCRWIEKREWFKNWLRPNVDGPRILWISGPPAAGKSVLAATTVDKIRGLYGRESCQYHNLSFADRNKRSASYLLRSMAYQIAHSKPLFRKKLLQFSEQHRASFRDMSPSILWGKVFLGLLFHLMPERPLYWVIDGLDESDSIPMIFECLKKIESDSLTLKVFLVSRPTADINTRVRSLQPSAFYVHHISHMDTKDDIRAYVSDLVPSIVPGSQSDHDNIIAKILSKASGNFFWVALVLKALEKNWYRRSDIDRVIEEFHSDMTPIYGRMMQKLDEQEDKDRKMASLIITWATFSFRPLSISELRKALETEFRDLTILEDIVRHVCAGFVQVHGSKVGLIHETAKHFLIHEAAQYKIQMVPGKGHEHLAIACLQHLSSKRGRQWRTVLKNIQDEYGLDRSNFGGNPSTIDRSYPFLVYAAQSWAYHLSMARTEGSTLQEMLFDFLKKDALTWINTIALLGDLTTLLRSAKYLKTFVKRQEKTLGDTNSVQLRPDDPYESKAWAMDLSRIVGKFGSILLSSPSSIYKIIPPFCPQSSMVKKYYEKPQNAFSVTGLSNPDWDDCRARRLVDPVESASRVLATVDVFVALVPSAHTLIIWHAETCEELRRISHEEYLREMAITKTGDLICTAGVITISVWDIASGTLLATVPITRDTHLIGLAFRARDEEILLGYQDHTVICYNWRRHDKVFEFRARSEGDIFGGVNIMKFSPDGTQVAIGSKGVPIEIWDLRRRSRAYRYMTEEDNARVENHNLVFPEAVEWHPDGGRVYLLYHNLRLVDWNPTFEEQKEYQVAAKNMVCSPCGRFLLTSDSRGAIRIFSLPDYVSERDQRIRLIYHLEYDGFVRDLTFHPDSQRFYDLRGTICNVWQPEALVQAEEPGTDDDGSSNADSMMSSGPAEAFQEDYSLVTAVAGGPRDFGFCCGREDGTLSIHDMKAANRLRSLPGHNADAAIVALHWSRSGNWIGSADDSGHILIRKIQIPSPKNPNLLIWKASDFHVNDGVLQLLISPDDKFLLVSSSSSVQLFDVKNKNVCQSHKLALQRQARWAQHPSNSDRVIRICSDRVHVFEWEELRLLQPVDGLHFSREHETEGTKLSETELVQKVFRDISFRSLAAPSKDFPDSMPEVTSIIQSRDRHVIIFETILPHVPGHGRHRRKRLELFRTAALDEYDSIHSRRGSSASSESSKDPETSIALEDLSTVSQSVFKLVGTYQNEIVFFNDQHWLCSWEIDTKPHTHRKHFALPQDWLNDETLRLTSMTQSGTLLCPRNGEVAIIKGGIKP
ncbi:MAG: hypothetical protein LQ345_003231 [Seirophora villosa]|nr:MAG: hypothetical protein LQ345_003231 [Seirophora villosa]